MSEHGSCSEMNEQRPIIDATLDRLRDAHCDWRRSDSLAGTISVTYWLRRNPSTRVRFQLLGVEVVFLDFGHGLVLREFEYDSALFINNASRAIDRGLEYLSGSCIEEVTEQAGIIVERRLVFPDGEAIATRATWRDLLRARLSGRPRSTRRVPPEPGI